MRLSWSSMFPPLKTKTPAPNGDGSLKPVVPPMLAAANAARSLRRLSPAARVTPGGRFRLVVGRAWRASAFTGTAQEGTSAGFVRVGLTVHGPTSLAASARVLSSVTACVRIGLGSIISRLPAVSSAGQSPSLAHLPGYAKISNDG